MHPVQMGLGKTVQCVALLGYLSELQVGAWGAWVHGLHECIHMM